MGFPRSYLSRIVCGSLAIAACAFSSIALSQTATSTGSASISGVGSVGSIGAGGGASSFSSAGLPAGISPAAAAAAAQAAGLSTDGLSLNQNMMLNRLGLNQGAANSETNLGNSKNNNRNNSKADSSDSADGDAGKQATTVRALTNTTEFQRFVAEMTGRSLPLFGYGLFGSGRYSSPSNVPVPADYILGPGDEIVINLWGGIDGSMNETIDRNGQVTLPKIGTFQLAGTRASQLESVLKAQFGKIYKGFQLNANVGRLRSIQIYVVGQARMPGTHQVSNVSTLIGTLFEIGGPSGSGSMRNIQVKRDGKVVTTFDVYDFIISGDKSKDIRLLAGDVIVFQPAGPRVAVLGALETPAIYELKSTEESLETLLSYGGGVLALTSPHKVLVERVQNKAPQAPRSVEERVLDAKGIKSTVKDADIVTLFKIGSEFSNAITLRGNVAAPLRYAFKPGMRIADLIPEREALIQGSYYTQKNSLVQFESGAAVSAGRVATEVRNMLEEINWDYATIERLNRTEIKTQLIQFNLYKAVVDRSPEHNLQLQPGDIVTIFGVNDVPVPLEKRTRFVTVGGEVKVPGIYQIKPGETLAQVLQRAGGVTSNGYLYGTVFTRASNRALQSQQLSKIAKEMELAASKVHLTRQQNADSTGNIANSEIALSNLIQSIKSVKPTGRIALELNPVKPELPNINLEDGDSITIPPTPSFIGVYGSVFTDSSFLYKESQAVRDYLRSAGVRRDADTDSVMIVRADGSVESNEGGSMFSNVLDSKLYPGDSVYVPDRLDRETVYNKFLRGAKDWTTILYQLALGAAAVRVLEK